MRLLRSELYRAFSRKWPYFTFALGILVAVYGYISIQAGNLSFNTVPHRFNAWYSFLQVFGQNSNSIWGWAVPLLASLPFGDTLIYDLNHGFEVPLLMRVGKNRYFFTKWLANIIVVASVSTAILSCSLLIALIWRRDVVLPAVLPPLQGHTIPAGLDLFSGVFASSYQPHVLSSLFWSHPALYSLMVIIIGVLVSISIGSITMVSSMWLKNRYLVLSAPFIFYMVLNVALQQVGLLKWLPFIMSSGFLQHDDSTGPTIVYWSLILLISLITLYFGPNRYMKLKLANNNSIDSLE